MPIMAQSVANETRLFVAISPSNPAIADLLQGKWPVCSDGGMIVCTCRDD